MGEGMPISLPAEGVAKAWRFPISKNSPRDNPF